MDAFVEMTDLAESSNCWGGRADRCTFDSS